MPKTTKTTTGDQKVRELQSDLRRCAERVREIGADVERILIALRAEPGAFAAVVGADVEEASRGALSGGGLGAAARELERAARHAPRGAAVRALEAVDRAA